MNEMNPIELKKSNQHSRPSVRPSVRLFVRLINKRERARNETKRNKLDVDAFTERTTRVARCGDRARERVGRRTPRRAGARDVSVISCLKKSHSHIGMFLVFEKVSLIDVFLVFEKVSHPFHPSIPSSGVVRPTDDDDDDDDATQRGATSVGIIIIIDGVPTW